MKNCKTSIFVLIILIAAILISGCSTVKPAGEDQMLEIIDLINAHDSENLAARSADVFLVDSEVLYNPKLIKNLWEGLAESGFKIAAPEIKTDRLLLPTDRITFGLNPEIDAFFNKYVPEKAAYFRVGTAAGEIVFILGPDDIGMSTIFAFGGPY